MRITFVISTLQMGGAERVLSLLANGFATRNHTVTILTFSSPQTLPYYELDSRISLLHLDLAKPSKSILGAISNNLKRICLLRKHIRATSPDVVLPLMDAMVVITILACMGLSIPVLGAEHIDPAHHNIGRFWDTLRTLTYPFAERILLLTSGIDTYFPARIRKRCAVMPNPVVVKCGGATQLSISSPSIIGLGRLADQKGFDILIRAFALIEKKHPKAKVWILGEGEKRAELEGLIHSLQLDDKVNLPGSMDSPGAYLAQADIFALSSRYEGFPIALCEALACGVATVSTKFSAGYSDILCHQENALVIERDDINSLAHALDTLLSDQKLRHKLAENSPEIMDRYGLDPVLDKWEKLFNEVVS